MSRNGVPFSAGAAYFCAGGPHLQAALSDLVLKGVVSQWHPRVGILAAYSAGSDAQLGFIPALHEDLDEVNLEVGRLDAARGS